MPGCFVPRLAIVNFISRYVMMSNPWLLLYTFKRVRLYPWSLSYLVCSVSVGIAFAVAKGK